EQAAHLAWLWLEAAGEALAPAAPAAMALRLFDELRLRAAIADALGACGTGGEDAWRLAARVRALLAHPAAGIDAEAWARLVADGDAAWAAGLGPGATPADAPAWLRLPLELGVGARSPIQR